MMLIDQVANEIIIASQILKTNNVSRIANEIGYRPILIINALYRADDQGKISYNPKRDTLSIAEDVEVESLFVTEGLDELKVLIEEFAGYLARDEKDVSIEELTMLLGGTPELHIKIAALKSSKLTTYEYTPPKDKKSTYTFVTLKENEDKKWGLKQFDPKNSKARKLADQAGLKETK